MSGDAPHGRHDGDHRRSQERQFYQTAPTGWKAKPVGTLLKYQRIQKSWPALATLKGYRVMYVSRGALGDKVFETAAVYFPTKGRAPAGGRRVMAWDHGTCGVGDSAAPSRYPWLYPEPVTAPWDWYAQWVGKLGRMGYIVTCPDYEGLGTPGPHPYLHAASEGQATIDAVRAARQLAAKLGVRASASAGASPGIRRAARRRWPPPSSPAPTARDCRSRPASPSRRRSRSRRSTA